MIRPLSRNLPSLIFFTFLSFLLLLPVQGRANPQIIEGLTQGTSYRILYLGAADPLLPAAIEKRLKEIDLVFSNYRPDSEISRFNAQKSLDWFPVSSELVSLVAFAETISQATAGAFDLTIGPLLQVWGFGPYKKASQDVPSEAAIRKAQALVDFRRLAWRKNPPALQKKEANLLVDLSGIAQGYSVDALAELLDAKGLKKYMVEIGGEVRTRGDKGKQGPWLIVLESPSVEPTAQSLTIHLKDMSLTTAGDYRNYFEKDGRRYSHILDPRSGRPIQHKLASVSILAATALESDGWDTALLILGPERARALIRERNLSTYMLLRQGTDFVPEATHLFAKALKQP